jgi:GTP pyrophosphokinase
MESTTRNTWARGPVAVASHIEGLAPSPPSPALVTTRRAIMAALRKRYPGTDLSVVTRATDYAMAAHAGQMRASGDAYVSHPLAVALIVIRELGLDPVAVAAALLHDVPEDTERTLADVEAEFGSAIAILVDGVTKLTQAGARTKEQAAAETIRKMLLAMSIDVRVVLIKLADRLHNMRTIGSLPPANAARIAHQTLDIYAPLAERLGLWQLKGELEDRSFAVLEPARFAEVSAALAAGERSRDAYIRRVIAVLAPALADAGIKATISGRPKHLYSIWRKMVRKAAAFGEVYDAYAVRLITDDVRDCYGALGVVHALWPPVPGEFDDYIATPKSNGYQSLHTAVVALDGRPLEVQIRTAAMHQASESGIAAHWHYKEGSGADRAYDSKLAWLRQLIDWQHDVVDAGEFVEGLKLDLFRDQVFVFTPTGDVKTLPAGSGPLDFAYLVHTQIGHRASGARVNGKMVPFGHVLASGDQVEILTSKDQSRGPSRDWLKLVHTPGARAKIRAYFRTANRADNIASGREALDRELRRLARRDLTSLGTGELLTISRSMGHADLDEFYAAIGDGSVRPGTVVARLGVIGDEGAPLPLHAPAARSGPVDQVRVAGASGLLTRVGGCCHPIPGEPIVGYVTRGKGVTIHRKSCPTVTAERDKGRLLDAEWEGGPATTYQVAVRLECQDRPGILAEVTTVLAADRVNIVSARTFAGPDGNGRIDAVIAVNSVTQLDRVLGQLEGVRGVERATREGA